MCFHLIERLILHERKTDRPVAISLLMTDIREPLFLTGIESCFLNYTYARLARQKYHLSEIVTKWLNKAKEEERAFTWLY